MTHDQKVAAKELMNTMSWRKIAKHLGLSKSTVSDYLRGVDDLTEQPPKVLFIDLEVAPSLTAAFSRFKAFASPDHVIKEPYIILYSYAWGADGGVFTDHILHDQCDDDTPDLLLTERLWELLDEADVVVAHNLSFDEGWVNQQMCKYDLPPPSKYQKVCTLKALKKAFKLPSNSLAASTQYFDIERKRDNSGISLWLRCMERDKDAVEDMKFYCEGDIIALQSLYKKILAYIPQHPNMSHYYDDNHVRCRSCGSKEMVAIEGKYQYTTLSRFKTLRCEGCGAVSRERKNTHSKSKMKSMVM